MRPSAAIYGIQLFSIVSQSFSNGVFQRWPCWVLLLDRLVRHPAVSFASLLISSDREIGAKTGEMEAAERVWRTAQPSWSLHTPERAPICQSWFSPDRETCRSSRQNIRNSEFRWWIWGQKYSARPISPVSMGLQLSTLSCMRLCICMEVERFLPRNHRQLLWAV